MLPVESVERIVHILNQGVDWLQYAALVVKLISEYDPQTVKLLSKNRVSNIAQQTAKISIRAPYF